MTFDRKTKLLLLLGVLNDAYADAASTIVNLQDFVSSHPDMQEEIDEFDVISILNKAKELEKLILEVMDRIKSEVYV